VLGAAVGPLIGGVLVQYGPAPTVLSYLLLLAVFAVAGLVLLFLPETAPNAGHGFQIRPRRISVPAPARRSFAILALAIATVWAFGGTFQALARRWSPTCCTARTACSAGRWSRCWPARGDRPADLRPADRPPAGGRRRLVLVAGVVVLLAGMATSSVPLFVAGIAVLGFGWGAVFMGAFRLMAALADPEHRGSLLAAVYVVAYVGMSLPRWPPGSPCVISPLRDDVRLRDPGRGLHAGRHRRPPAAVAHLPHSGVTGR